MVFCSFFGYFGFVNFVAVGVGFVVGFVVDLSDVFFYRL